MIKSPFVFLLGVLVFTSGTLVSKVNAEVDKNEKECLSVQLDSTNIVGVFSYPLNPYIESVRVIYKSSKEQKQVTLQLLKRDALTLKQKVGMLLSNEVTHPLILQRERVA